MQLIVNETSIKLFIERKEEKREAGRGRGHETHAASVLICR